MQCLILAGGLGTRIRAVTGALPKALIPIHGRPFIRYQLEWLAAHGVDRVVISIGHLGEMIRAALGERAFGVTLRYSDEGHDLRGTGGAVRFALDQGLLDPGFFVLYGDSYLPIDPRPLWAASGEGRHPTMSVLKNDGRWDRSNVVLRDGMIALYDKAHPDPAAAGIAYIDFGLSVLTAECVRAHVASGAKGDLADLFAAESRAGRLRGYEVFERFYEVGSPQGLADLTQHLEHRRLPREHAGSA